MKKTISLLLASLFLTASLALARDVWISSTTATADTTQNLCVRGQGILHGVCVNTGAAGTLTVFASSGTSTRPIAAIDTTAKGCMHYDVLVSTRVGLTYTNSATANVTIMYDCK